MLSLPQAFDAGLENQLAGLRVSKTPGARTPFPPATDKAPQQAGVGDGAGGAGGCDPTATPLRSKGANTAGRALRTPLGNISNRAPSNAALSLGQLQSLSTPSMSKPPPVVLENVADGLGSDSAHLPPIEQYHTCAPSSTPFLDGHGNDIERAVRQLIGETHAGGVGVAGASSRRRDPLHEAPMFVEPRVETASELAAFGTPTAMRPLQSLRASHGHTLLPRAMSDAREGAANGSLQVAASVGEEDRASTAAHKGEQGDADVGLEVDLNGLDFSQLALGPRSSSSDSEDDEYGLVD